MKQRITYMLPEGTGIDPADISVGSSNLSYTKAAQAAEEWRVTLDLDELPDEVCIQVSVELEQ